jgi:SAM-dependent methyltransferase
MTGPSATPERAPSDPFAAFEAAGWERAAAGYTSRFAPITGRVHDDLLDAVGAGPGTRLLDVACGPGAATAAAARRGADAVGVDLSAAMVELASRSKPDLTFQVAPAEALPFADGSFDAVVAGFLVHHISDLEPVLAEFRRVLAPGGRVALTAWSPPDQARFIGVLLDAVAAVGASPPPDLPAGPPFFRPSGDGALAAELERCGLAGVESRRIAFTHPFAGADDLWALLMEATVRMAPLVRGQSEPVREQIRAQFDRLLEPYARDGGGYDVPVSVQLAAGRVAG